MSASLDGRITFAPNLTMFDAHPAEKLLADAKELWQKLTDAIEESSPVDGTMMGSGTVERTAAPLRALPPFRGDAQELHEDFLPADVLECTRKWAILVDGRGRCRSGYKAAENPHTHILHLVSHAAPADYLAFLRNERVPYLIGGQAHADLPAAMHKLQAKLKLKHIRLWGGGTLNGAMLRAGLIDELHLIVWPLLIGGQSTPTLADCPDLGLGDLPLRLQLVAAQPQPGGHLWLHYRRSPANQEA